MQTTPCTGPAEEGTSVEEADDLPGARSQEDIVPRFDAEGGHDAIAAHGDLAAAAQGLIGGKPDISRMVPFRA